jgi:hypothetical protein
MAADPMNLEVLASVANQIEATAITNALADRGIRATAVGAWTSQFQTEAPGDVKIMVARADLTRAAESLVEVRREFANFDWSVVDIPEDEPAEEERRPPIAAEGNRGLQFSIAAILIVQALASAALAFWRTVYVGLGGGVAAFVIAFTIMSAAMLVAAVAATVFIASDLSRARRVATVMVLAELGALAVTGFVVLLSMALRLLGL